MLDTGVFYAFFDSKDAHHLDSTALLIHCLEGKYGQPFTSDYVVLETTLLAQRRLGSRVPLAFLDFLRESKIRTIVSGLEYYERALDLYYKNYPRLSVCDSASLAIMNDLGILTLASYDDRSFSGLVKEIHGGNYFESLSSEERKRISKKVV